MTRIFRVEYNLTEVIGKSKRRFQWNHTVSAKDTEEATKKVREKVLKETWKDDETGEKITYEKFDPINVTLEAETEI